MEGLRAIILDHDSAPLKSLLQAKTVAEMKRQNVAGAEAGSSHLVQTEEDKLNRIMQMASTDSFPPSPIEVPDALKHYFAAAAAEEESNAEEDDDDDEDNDEEGEHQQQQQQQPQKENEAPWIPAMMPPPTAEYSWFYTVFYRVNGAFKLHKAYLRCNTKDKFMSRKIWRFQEAHLQMVQYLDQLPVPPTDANIDEEHLLSLYKPLGDSHYEVDASFVRVSRAIHQLKRTPLEIIVEAYPDYFWTPEEIAQEIRAKTIDRECLTPWLDGEWNPLGPVIPDVESHTLYYGVVYVLNQARELILDDTTTDAVRDALWAYYVSFLDLFYCCSRFDDSFLITPLGSEVGRDGKLILTDKLSPWELYGTMDTRAFTAGDLPDFIHVLASIPLWGEQCTYHFIGKIYQKSLPFACQRRHLIKLVVKHIEEDAAFWRVFSKFCWVMLANLYPGELACKNTTLTMRDLMRVRQLTDSKELLVAALTAKQPGFSDKKAAAAAADGGGGANGGPLVVFTIFRLHILYMASFNPQYVEQAKKCIDWEYFKKDVLKLANIVRGQNLFPDDPFAQARKQLSKTVKSPHSRVHRLRKRSLAVCLMDHFNETLEKTLLKNKQNFTNDLPKLMELQKSVHRETTTLVVCDEFQQKFQETVLGNHLIHAQKDCFSSLVNFAAILEKSIQVSRDAVAFYKRLSDVSFKAPILNALIRMQPHVRLTERAFFLLTLPEYGGVSTHCVALLCDLVRIYHVKAAPREFKQRIDKLSAPHFMVACFYLNMVALLEKISFAPLDADTVARTDQAMMTKRHYLFPGQDVPEDVYTVSIALCCEKICTLMGHGKHGDKRVAYDIETQAFVCAHGKTLKSANPKQQQQQQEQDVDAYDADEDDDNEDEDGQQDTVAVLLEAQNDNELDFDVGTLKTRNIASDLTADASTMKGKGTKRTLVMQSRKATRGERKAFSKIPCGQPVLTFSLRGRALIWGNTLESKTQVMFCPSCGALHVFSLHNFSCSESGMYRCNECARKDLMHVPHRRCAYCQKPTNHDLWLEVMCPVVDPTDPAFDPLLNPEGVLQLLYFCKTHYNLARGFVYSKGGVTKPDLWKLVKIKQDQRNLQYARGIYKK